MSISIVLIEKTGTCKDIKIKDFKKENLYKKCNFRKNENFELRNNWKINKFGFKSVELWARNTGKAGLENKYDLPPPIDKELYFGTMAVIGVDENDKIIGSVSKRSTTATDMNEIIKINIENSRCITGIVLFVTYMQ